ncbi:hypothetical protein [Methylobacterium sp. NEAU K]|uniref:hypothetical protein n=1 Tax=Methylobacterium sp. NEAU K TaxID=3064946 RepID=UPI00273323A6|nr:hypothetical protein [Methylobacterium sp. NEAU K]MDP4005993.1 hypothetical protein [Methylobacterium sp. NEAU K]
MSERRTLAGTRSRHVRDRRPLPESLTRFLTDAKAEAPAAPVCLSRPGGAPGRARDITTVLLAAAVILWVGGHAMQAW